MDSMYVLFSFTETRRHRSLLLFCQSVDAKSLVYVILRRKATTPVPTVICYKVLHHSTIMECVLRENDSLELHTDCGHSKPTNARRAALPQSIGRGVRS